MAGPELDFRLLFEESPDISVVLLPDAPHYTMVAATRARFRATHTSPETLGKGLFELFPDNPDATGTSNLRASLNRVVATGAPDTMAAQKYDIRGPDGSFEAKYWRTKNIPVVSAAGEVTHILHRVEDVTGLVAANQSGEAMEREVAKRGADLTAANSVSREAPASAAEGERAHVLIAYDNAGLGEYMAGLLGGRYDVSVVTDGRAALEAVRARMPDLVVSDVTMPSLDGVGLVRELRAAPATASLPVILLSAHTGEDPSIDGLDVGADDYIAKPFSARELLARVRPHLELAKARRRWVTELERTNRELEAFSYSVSHDLRAPLRAISGFSEILLEDHGEQLDAESKDCIDEIRKAVASMSELIQDLIELARVARAPLDVALVDLSQLARDVVAGLRRAQPVRQVTIDIADNLAAEGDGRLLEVVLVNLIGNAWKFTSRTEAARIEVGCKAGPEPTFFVRDNGAGFDAAYAAKLFAPFQRLHSVSEFEGTGIGLSTVQRVIHRHRGRVWAEGAVGEGATFSFTLPAS